MVPTKGRRVASRFALRGCRAIVTGASSGLGAEFARQLAPVADALLLTARRADRLEVLRSELLNVRPDLVVECCPGDVATSEGRGLVVERIATNRFAPNLLINNAGLGDYGTFASADSERLAAQIDVNVSGLVMLTHALLPHLVRTAGRPAGVLNVSSLAGTLPLPDAAVYAATKAFVTSFSEAIRIELAPENIIVSAVCPGPTPTGFRHVARREGGHDTDRSKDGLLTVPPGEVVRHALAALEANRALVFPGWGPTGAGWLFRVVSRPLLRWLLRRRFARSQLSAEG